MLQPRKLLVKFAYIALVLIAIVILLWVYIEYSEKREVKNRDKTFIMAKQIVEAIEDYNQKNGNYPESLQLLAPSYIDQVKQPCWGNSGWIYRLQKEGFYLSVGYGNEFSRYPSIYYDYQQKAWMWDF